MCSVCPLRVEKLVGAGAENSGMRSPARQPDGLYVRQLLGGPIEV